MPLPTKSKLAELLLDHKSPFNVNEEMGDSIPVVRLIQTVAKANNPVVTIYCEFAYDGILHNIKKTLDITNMDKEDLLKAQEEAFLEFIHVMRVTSNARI